MNEVILERIVFKHKTKNYYLVADAYDGRYISDCTIDFLKSCSGIKKDTVMVGKTVIGISGNARLVSYVGHNGLMDFKLANTYQNTDDKTRDAIIIACASKQYFSQYLKTAKANPLVWSTHLMSAEAYTVHDAIRAYINGQPASAVREAAASAYNNYQKCGINGGKKAACHRILTLFQYLIPGFLYSGYVICRPQNQIFQVRYQAVSSICYIILYPRRYFGIHPACYQPSASSDFNVTVSMRCEMSPIVR